MTPGLPQMKSVITPLGESILVPLRLTAAISATDAAIKKKIFGSVMNALIIWKEEMEDIMKISKYWMKNPIYW